MAADATATAGGRRCSAIGHQPRRFAAEGRVFLGHNAEHLLMGLRGGNDSPSQ